jgi:hypothetical protein
VPYFPTTCTSLKTEGAYILPILSLYDLCILTFMTFPTELHYSSIHYSSKGKKIKPILSLVISFRSLSGRRCRGGLEGLDLEEPVGFLL